MKTINMLVRILLVVAVPIALPHLVVHLSEQAKVHTAASYHGENTTVKDSLGIEGTPDMID